MLQPSTLRDGVLSSFAPPPTGEPSLYREIFERSTDAIAIIDPHGFYHDQNAAHEALFGYTTHELRALTPAMHLGENEFAAIIEVLQRTGRYNGIITTHTRQGVERRFELTAYAVRAADGTIDCYVGVTRDVTERLHAENELQRHFAEIEALYRMTAAVSRNVSLERIYHEALEALHRALGADRASVLLFDPDDVMRFKAARGLSEAYMRAVEGHSPWRRDVRDPQAFGINDVAAEMEPGALRETILGEGIRACAFIPLVWAAQLLGKFMIYYDQPHVFTDEELRLASTVARQIALAITRVRADEALRAREREYKTLTDNMPQLIARLDRELRYLYVNPAVEAPTGRKRSDYLGRAVDELGFMPEVESLARKRLTRVIETGEPVKFEYTYPTTAGVRNYTTHAVPEFNEEGEVVSVISITNDFTERVQAEERQRFLAETSTRLLESLDFESTLNNLAQLMIEAIADRCAIDITAPDGSLRRVCEVAKDALGGPEVSSMRLPLRARGRDQGMITLASHDEHKTYGPADRAFAEEIAQRAALVIDNARLYQEAHDANLAKSAFLATMSHELRTPLNAILGYAELMELGVAGSVSEKQTQQLERISASAWHLLTVIEEILTFSRVEAGREEVHVEAVDAGDLVAEAASMVEPAAARKALQFVVTVPAAPLSLRTDRGKVRQVLLNLLSNAVKFTEAGRIECSAEPHGKGVRFRVSDSGPGIAPEHCERVFEAFWQVAQGATRKIGGTGLGLTVSRQLAQLLGGDITLESTLGQGSTFVVTLPSLKD